MTNYRMIRLYNNISSICAYNILCMQISRIILSCISVFTFATAEAQDIAAVLQSIEQSNTRLAAARQMNAAEIASQQAENVIGATSLEYSPFFHGGYRGIASSELIVTQEFDYPTLYRERRKSTELRQDVLELEYRTLRRDILLDATKSCYDLVAARQSMKLIRKRIAATDSLLALYNRRLDHGHATILDLNRIKLDRMSLLTEEAECQGDELSIIDHLQTLNGGQPLPDISVVSVDEDLVFDIFTEAQTDYTPEPLEVATAEAEVTFSRHERALSRKSWYPTFTAGFRVNTEMRDANGGFVVGVAFPLFANSKRQQASAQKMTAAELALADARAESLSRTRALRTEAENLQRKLRTYDADLMEESLTVLLTAVLAGEISIMEYYTAAERTFAMLQERLAIAAQLRKVYADLRRDEL